MSFAAKVGLGVAVENCVKIGIDSIWRTIQKRAQYLRKCLSEVPGVTIHDRGPQLCGIVSFTKEGWTADRLQATLHALGVNTSVSRAPSSRIDFEERGLDAVVRASVHYYNTDAEVRKFIDKLGAIT